MQISGFPEGTSAHELIAYLSSKVGAFTKLTIVESGFNGDGSFFVVVDSNKECIALTKLNGQKLNGNKLFVKKVFNPNATGKLMSLFVKFIEQNYDAAVS